MRPKSRKNRRAEQGVTKLELALGLAMAGLLAGGVAFWHSQATEGERGQAVKTAKVLLGAASDFKRTKPQLGCPTVSLLMHEDRYDRSAPADDPWGGRFRIHCSEEDVQVRSAGEDGRFATPDDIILSEGWNS